jgi:hypothetical protein
VDDINKMTKAIVKSGGKTVGGVMDYEVNGICQHLIVRRIALRLK